MTALKTRRLALWSHPLRLSLRTRLSLLSILQIFLSALVLALFINLGTKITTRPMASALVCDTQIVCVSTRGGQIPQRVPVAPTTVADVLRNMRLVSIFGVVLVLLAGATTTYIVTGLALRPLVAVSRTAKDVDSRWLDTRVAFEGPDDEVKDMAIAFNEMLDRLQASFMRERRFVSDASHELRTPLSTMRMNLDVIRSHPNPGPSEYEHLVTVVDRALLRVEDLTRDLLTLATSGKLRSVERVALEPLLVELTGDFQALANQKHVQLQIDSREGIHIIGSAVLMRHALANVIENAILYNHPGGRVRIAAFCEQTSVVITIEDTGLGIPNQDLPHVFERFYRVDKSRTRHTGGAGLGLSLAHEIVCQHSGTITARSELAVGTTFTIRLPVR